MKVRRMIEQTGGYSAGAYDIGHPEYYKNQSLSPPAIHKNRISKQGKKTIRLRLEYVVDEITGDVRIAQK